MAKAVREKLLDAALIASREKGRSVTVVDNLRVRANVTKAASNSRVALDSVDHLKRYIELQFVKKDSKS